MSLSGTHGSRMLLAACLAAPLVAAGRLSAATDQLAAMSLEDLMNVEVTSFSRYRQKVSQAPAAVSVITQDDISRSGLHNIPELMRLAPGMSVARIGAHDWAISARGFNDKYANKLLVLVDGRTVYAPLFSGVAWDQQGYILEDLDRIEVIRGPGATMWGANAVNGVINITTKNARDTQGLLVSGLAGNVENVASLRYGGTIDDETYYRVFGMFSKTEDFVDAAGEGQFDGWQSTRGGFRIDRFCTPNDTLSLQGEAHQNLFAERGNLPSFMPPFTIPADGTHYGTGAHILGRWTHTVCPESEYSVQLYYDRFYRTQNVLRYVQHTFDAEFQHRFPLGDRQSIVWGFGARYLIQSTEEVSIIRFDPEDRDDYRLNVFVQDDVAIVPDRFRLIIGSKFEYSSYSDFEYQPGARLLWTPNERHTVWAAVSRAVRTPTPEQQDAIVLLTAFPGFGDTPTGIVTEPNDDFESEELTAYELGYRVKPTERLSIDLALFFNHYEGLRTSELGLPRFEMAPTPRVIMPLRPDNGVDADSYGVEAAVNLNVTEDWRVTASYSLVDIQAHARSSSADATTEGDLEGASPQSQAQVHSYYRLTRALELNASAYYVETLPALDVPGYVRVDLGMTWRPRQNLALRVGVQNLLDDRHPEFGLPFEIYGPATESPRTVYGQLTWEF